MQSEIKELKKDFLALLPCPLKVPLEKAFLESIGEKDFSYALEGNANHHELFTDTEEDIDFEDIPDILISSGVNKFYYKPFIDAYIKKGLFEDVFDEGHYKDNPYELNDPFKSLHIIAMNLLVMAVDLTVLGDKKMPRGWKDLLGDAFENQVAIRGKDEKYCETTLLGIYKDYGENGIKALARSVKYGWHPSQMVKTAGKGKAEAPSVSIMPYFYAKMLENNPQVKIVWPEEGAIVSPVTLLVKKEREKQLSSIISFFKSQQVREICSNCYLPNPYDFIEKEELKDKKLNWIGWHFIYKEDIKKVLKHLNSFFIK